MAISNITPLQAALWNQNEGINLVDPDMRHAAPTISVVIRNRNGGMYLKTVLDALQKQVGVDFEIVLVDNESEDDSVQMASAANARIITIDKASFTYGRALNYGMQAAKGEVCVLLSVHALPVGPHFLGEAVAPFQDPKVAATRCINVGHKQDLKQWHTPLLLQHPAKADTVFKRGPVATACAIRKSVWEQVPFDERLESDEDKVWASDVLQRGYSIYTPCPALYLYMRELNVMKLARRRHWSDLAYFRLTKKTKYPLNKILGSVLMTLLMKAPKAAVREVVKGVARNYYRLRLPIDIKREPEEGSTY